MNDLLQFHTLPNGIRLIHQPETGAVAHLGLIINAGSRDELPEMHGLAHFIEHVIFKGTTHRKAYHILSRMEDVGGELDAYTTKEETCIYTAFLKDYYERAMELISDIVFNSTFPEKELIKEKEVILDEINSYKDNPGELIFDDFEDLIFDGHAIGRNILGTAKQLKKLGRSHIEHFIKSNYHTNELVVCSVGDISFTKLVHQFEKWFGWVEPNIRTSTREALNVYNPVNKIINKRTHQAHCIVGTRAYSINHHGRLPLELLNNILGGPGLNSRLNLALREKHGFTYNIESFYTSYTDTGVLGVYFGTEEDKLEKSLSIVRKEIKRLRDVKLGVLQLDRAQKQMIGQLAIASENKGNALLNIGRSYLLFNKVDSLQTVFEKISKVNSNQIQDVANELLDEQLLSNLIYK